MDKWEKWLMLFVMVIMSVMLCVDSYQNEELSNRCCELELRCDELEFRSFRVDELMGMIYYLRDGIAKYLAYQKGYNDTAVTHINNLWMGLSEDAQLLGWCCEEKLLENWQAAEVEVKKQPEEDRNDPSASAYHH